MSQEKQMTAEEFAEWCKYFKRQLLKEDEDHRFLVEWLEDIRVFSLEAAKEAVMHCVRTSTKYDKPAKLLLPKIVHFLQERARAQGLVTKRDRSLADVESLRGEAWRNSELRKKFRAAAEKLGKPANA